MLHDSMEIAPVSCFLHGGVAALCEGPHAGGGSRAGRQRPQQGIAQLDFQRRGPAAGAPRLPTMAAETEAT